MFFRKNFLLKLFGLFLVFTLFPKPAFSKNLCSDLFLRTTTRPLPKTFKDSLVRELKAVIKAEQTPELSTRLKNCGPGCLELESNSFFSSQSHSSSSSSSRSSSSSPSPSVFRIEQDIRLTEPQIVFSRETGTKTLKVPENFFSSSASTAMTGFQGLGRDGRTALGMDSMTTSGPASRSSPTSRNFLRRWLIGHELHPYNSIPNGRLVEKPVQTEALRAYDQAVESGHRSFLHIAPTAVGKALVFSKALLKRIKNMEPGKKVIFVTVDRIHLVDQISSAIEALAQSRNSPVRLINWNNKRENSSNSGRLFVREVRRAINLDVPTVFFITSQSLKLRLAGLREKDPEVYRDLVSSLESLFFDEAHHYGAYQTRKSLESLIEESGAFLFGSTATPVHSEVRLTDLFEVSHFSYLREGGGDHSGSVSKKTLLQLSRAIERGDITGFDDIYVLGEIFFKRPDAKEPLFKKESESGYQVINPHYYNRLVDLLSPILLSNRRGFIVTASIREAERLSGHLNKVFGESIGFSPFHSGMSRRERREVLKRSEEETSKSHYIVSVRALDEGVNLPRLSAYIDLNSNVSVKQMLHRVGRVLRITRGKLESEIVLLSDYKNQRLSEDLLELLDAMRVVSGFRGSGNRNRNGSPGALDVGVSGRVISREELSASRELLEEVARNYWSRNVEGKVGYELFETRILEAIERGELDPHSMFKTYRQWQKNHPDMPAAPGRTYKGQFPGWPKLLEKHGIIKTVELVNYETFETRILEAVEKGELDPHSMAKTYPPWQKNNSDMPSNPREYYRGQFPGWPKLLEKHGIIKTVELVDYKTFETRILEALEKGELDPHRMEKTYGEWQKNHPDMPAGPGQTYKGQFPGWPKLLEKHGIIKIVEFVDYKTFGSRILEAVEKGELDPNSMKKTYRPWRKNHPDMPAHPDVTYKDQFPGWRKFFEKYGIIKFVDYETFETRILEALERGELDPRSMEKTYGEWQKNHPDLPDKPYAYYKGQFPRMAQIA